MPSALPPIVSARQAGLRYVTDAEPGIRRTHRGRGVVYLDANGATVRNSAMLARIRRLAIPPAWRDVWICADPLGHLQATGRDARGRKQSRYHPRWRQVRDADKYARMLEFGTALPRIRARVERDLRRSGLPREKVLATVVRLMERTLIRIGNEEYRRANRSYGLTTMENRHARVAGDNVVFEFRGKSGRRRRVGLEDPRLARIVARCQELPGHHLFEYLGPEGEPHPIGSAEVNQYLRELSGQDFTAKDFRTWAGSVLAAMSLARCRPCVNPATERHNIVEAIEAVADRLGNTPAVCRKCYVHPAVLDAYTRRQLKPARDLRSQERALLRLLRATA